MKLKNKMILIIVGIVTISLTGCGTDKDKMTENLTEEVVATPIEDEILAKDEDEPMLDPGDKDTGEFMDEDVFQTDPKDIGGEGMTDDTVPDLTGIEESLVGEPVTFTNDAGADLCLFAIEAVESSDMDIENMGEVTGLKVVIVSYSYTNQAHEGSLLFDDMSFKLVANDELCIPYFTPKLTPAAPSETGETAFGQVAFLAPENCSDVIVVLDNTSVNAKAIFKAEVE